MVKKEMLTLRISERLKRQVEKRAEELEKNVSEYVLDLIKRDIEKRGE